MRRSFPTWPRPGFTDCPSARPTAAGKIPGGELYRLVLDTLTGVIEAAIGQSTGEADPAKAPSAPARDEPATGAPAIEEPATGAPVMDEPVIDENVQFTVYRPRAVRVGVWYPLLAFAHLAERSPDAPPDQPDPVDRVKAWAAQILGGDVADYASPTSDARGAVPRESELTFVPEIERHRVQPAAKNVPLARGRPQGGVPASGQPNGQPFRWSGGD